MSSRTELIGSTLFSVAALLFCASPYYPGGSVYKTYTASVNFSTPSETQQQSFQTYKTSLDAWNDIALKNTEAYSNDISSKMLKSDTHMEADTDTTIMLQQTSVSSDGTTKKIARITSPSPGTVILTSGSSIQIDEVEALQIKSTNLQPAQGGTLQVKYITPEGNEAQGGVTSVDITANIINAQTATFQTVTTNTIDTKSVTFINDQGQGRAVISYKNTPTAISRAGSTATVPANHMLISSYGPITTSDVYVRGQSKLCFNGNSYVAAQTIASSAGQPMWGVDTWLPNKATNQWWKHGTGLQLLTLGSRSFFMSPSGNTAIGYVKGNGEIDVETPCPNAGKGKFQGGPVDYYKTMWNWWWAPVSFRSALSVDRAPQFNELKKTSTYMYALGSNTVPVTSLPETVHLEEAQYTDLGYNYWPRQESFYSWYGSVYSTDGKTVVSTMRASTVKNSCKWGQASTNILKFSTTCSSVCSTDGDICVRSGGTPIGMYYGTDVAQMRWTVCKGGNAFNGLVKPNAEMAYSRTCIPGQYMHYSEGGGYSQNVAWNTNAKYAIPEWVRYTDEFKKGTNKAEIYKNAVSLRTSWVCTKQGKFEPTIVEPQVLPAMSPSALVDGFPVA
jgi:hypothetical protein